MLRRFLLVLFSPHHVLKKSKQQFSTRFLRQQWKGILVEQKSTIASVGMTWTNSAVGKQVQFGAMETDPSFLGAGAEQTLGAGAGGCLVLAAVLRMAPIAHLPLLPSEFGGFHGTWHCCRGLSMCECRGHSAGRGMSAARAPQSCCLQSQSRIRLLSIWHTGCWSFV